MHKIIANSPDLFRGTSGHDSSEFKLALRLEDYLFQEMNSLPDTTVFLDRNGWKYRFEFSNPRYGLEFVFSNQMIENALTDKNTMAYLIEIVFRQIDKDWPLTKIGPEMGLVRVFNR